MPFHVEVSSPLDRARILNVEEADLRASVLEPWIAGLPFELGGRRWKPRESRLTILEGPALETGGDPEEGWAGALRAAEDVTRPRLEAAEADAPARTAVIVEATSVEAALRKVQAGRIPRQIPWSDAVERIGSNDPEVTTLILVVEPSQPAWPRL